MKRVLFLCTGNSFRSQMAEGFVNHLFPGRIEAKSAGVEPSSLNPNAVKAMAEVGIDISQNKVNNPEDFRDVDFDYLITLCDHANESCPLFLSQKPMKRLHWGFPDPARLEEAGEALMEKIRLIRDDLRRQIEDFFGKN